MRINRNQLVVLWSGIALVAVMCLLVPWIEAATPLFTGSDWPVKPADCGYGLIFLLEGGQRLDVTRLAVQCAAVAVVAAALVAALRKPVMAP